MTEDEIIEIVKNEITNTYAERKAIAFQGLLDLYQKEKEKNFIFKNATIVTDLENDGIEINMKADDLVKLYLQEKEKNKELENADLTTVYLNGFYDGEKKWKDKISGKIEELDIEIQQCQYADDDIEEYKNDMEKEKSRLLRDKKILQESLEGNNGKQM